MSLSKDKSYNILFIGNSYTYYNRMPEEIFTRILELAGYDAKVTSITMGGWTLGHHSDPKEELTGVRVAEALASNQYDYIVLQEMSTRPASDPDIFLADAEKMVKAVKENGAKPVFYATWGRKKGSPELEKYGWTTKEMSLLLENSYKKAASAAEAVLAPVGRAFLKCDSICGDWIDLYDPDLTHPSYAGSFLAAMTIFGAIFDVDPVSLPYAGELPDDVAAVLKEAALGALEELE